MPNNSKFTPARRKALLELLKKAVPIGIACDKIGIDRTTYYLWKNRAERYNPVDKGTKDDKPYHDFFQKIHEARAAAFQQLLNEIMQMGMGYQTTEKVEEYHEKDGKIAGQKKNSCRHPLYPPSPGIDLPGRTPLSCLFRKSSPLRCRGHQ